MSTSLQKICAGAAIVVAAGGLAYALRDQFYVKYIENRPYAQSINMQQFAVDPKPIQLPEDSANPCAWSYFPHSMVVDLGTPSLDDLIEGSDRIFIGRVESNEVVCADREWKEHAVFSLKRSIHGRQDQQIVFENYVDASPEKTYLVFSFKNHGTNEVLFHSGTRSGAYRLIGPPEHETSPYRNQVSWVDNPELFFTDYFTGFITIEEGDEPNHKSGWTPEIREGTIKILEKLPGMKKDKLDWILSYADKEEAESIPLPLLEARIRAKLARH